jgi:YHS domain-containing protein
MLRTGTVLALALATAGCSQGPSPSAPAASAPAAPQPRAAARDEEHAHKPGSHGGTIVEIGRDSYHAEVVLEKGGLLRLYVLGQDEGRVQEADAQVLSAFARADEAGESLPLALRPVPQAGDRAGQTSQFVGTLPRPLLGRPIQVTIPSIRIGGERFRVHFTTAGTSQEIHPPAGAAGDEERQLYLTPGGKYTQADIQANGRTTASARFQGQMAAHDLKARPGDRICPITQTRANPKFSWIIGGKTYQFCCPPCIDEFVKTAKEQPDQIKPPEDYVKP